MVRGRLKTEKKPSAGFKCYFVDLDIGQSFFQKKHSSLLALPKNLQNGVKTFCFSEIDMCVLYLYFKITGIITDFIQQ